jgi:hypothetical protein
MGEEINSRPIGYGSSVKEKYAEDEISPVRVSFFSL